MDLSLNPLGTYTNNHLHLINPVVAGSAERTMGPRKCRVLKYLAQFANHKRKYFTCCKRLQFLNNKLAWNINHNAEYATKSRLT